VRRRSGQATCSSATAVNYPFLHSFFEKVDVDSSGDITIGELHDWLNMQGKRISSSAGRGFVAQYSVARGLFFS